MEIDTDVVVRIGVTLVFVLPAVKCGQFATGGDGLHIINEIQEAPVTDISCIQETGTYLGTADTAI